MTIAKKKKKSPTSSSSPARMSRSSRIDEIETLASDYLSVGDEEKAIKKRKSDISGRLLELMRAMEAKKFESGDVRVTSVTTTREKLDVEKLIKAGVSTAVIKRCTVQGKPSTSIRVSELKEPRASTLIVTEEELS